jgi:hypothetical protein
VHNLNIICLGNREIERWIRENVTSGQGGWKVHCKQNGTKKVNNQLLLISGSFQNLFKVNSYLN